MKSPQLREVGTTIVPFCKWKNGSTEGFSDFPKVTELENDGDGASPAGLQACCIRGPGPGSLGLHFQLSTGPLMGVKAWESLLPDEERTGKQGGPFCWGNENHILTGCWLIATLINTSLRWKNSLHFVAVRPSCFSDSVYSSYLEIVYYYNDGVRDKVK